MYTLNCKGRLLVIDRPIVMGIINATPDSFYSGSRQPQAEDALRKAEQMLREGATILDIGGQSTRPGSAEPGMEEELARILPVIEAISSRFPDSFLSVDTYHSKVAEAAIAHGASMVNDISAGLFDTHMLAVTASLKVPYICMHVQGTADTMHEKPVYANVVREVLDYFMHRVAEASDAGIKDIIIDPGFGFSKSTAANFTLLKHLDLFSLFERPVLLGVSRKSTIYKTLGITVDESLNGTTVLHTAGLLKGASILRVHDVKEAMEAIKLTGYLM